MDFAILLLLVLASMVTATPWRRHRHWEEKIMQADEAPFRREAIEGNLKDSDQINEVEDEVDVDDDGSKSIDELMPDGGDDESESDDEQKVMLKTRADYGKSLEELFPQADSDERYAPSDESFEHFEMLKRSNITMKDVKESDRQSSNAIRKNYWPKATVPYEFGSVIGANPKYQGKIFGAMKEWQLKTCVKFRPYSRALASQLGHNHRIRVVTSSNEGPRGCWSQTGMSRYHMAKGEPQIVNLDPSGCMLHRVALHELGHALGFHHEQTRMDRDEFITVYKHNVEKKKWNNFEEKDGLTSAPYDYLSIMQYGKTFFGIYLNGKNALTMQTLDKCYEDLIGKARHLSYYDHKAMNSIYGCSKECYNTPCGKNCYATKSGENSECHCVCLDHSNNPCKGGSCFIGDVYSDCAELVAKNPSKTCYNHGVGGKIDEKCCESCKGVEIDSECPEGDRYGNCAEMIAKNPSGTCYKYGVGGKIDEKCCRSCKGVEIDSECPEGDRWSDCAELLQKNPTNTCSQSRREGCCKSCKGIKVDPSCPQGNTAPNCDDFIKQHGKELVCAQNRHVCCTSCIGS